MRLRVRRWLSATQGVALAVGLLAAVESAWAGAPASSAGHAAGVAMAAVIVSSVTVAGATMGVWCVLPGVGAAAAPVRRARAAVGGALVMVHVALSLASAQYLAAHFRDPTLMAMVAATLAGALAAVLLVVGVGLADRLVAPLERLELGEPWPRGGGGRTASAIVWVVMLGASAWACARIFAQDGEPSEAGRIGPAAARLLDAATDLDGDGAGSLRAPRDCGVLDAAIHPGAKDVRANGIDEDCDGRDRASRHRRRARGDRGRAPPPATASAS